MAHRAFEILLEKSHTVIKRVGLLKRAKEVAHPLVNQLFFLQLMQKTENFADTKWMGQVIRQNILDLWVIQETLVELRPELLIETGTHQGGSALFYAHLFDLMNHGRVITVDIERMHSLTHPRVEFLIGSSTSDGVVDHVRKEAAAAGSVMVILDSDHSKQTVSRELELYSPLVTQDSYILAQDGIMDALPVLRNNYQPGPLPAIREFLKDHPEFEVDREKCERFLITHHPEGWLKRRSRP